MNKKHSVRVAAGILLLAMVLLVTRSLVLNQELSIKAEAGGPRVVAQSPIEGQRLELDSEIAFTFDKEMDPASTESSFSLLGPDLEPVPGTFTWRDPRTLIFTPSNRYFPGTEYTALITTDAMALDGTNILENVEIPFTTVEALAVAQVFPSAGTTEVELNTSVTAIFNHPVVPLQIEEERSNLPQPLKFTPEVEGTGTWVNSSVYVFQPQDLLLSGAEYEVRVEAGLTDTNSNSLSDPFTWEFHTRQPYIADYLLENGPYNPHTEVSGIRLDQAFIVNFGQPMDRGSVEAETAIMNRETSASFPIEFKWNEESTSVKIKPRRNFMLAGFYELTLADQAQAQDGGRLREGLQLQFATIPYPAITEVLPSPDSRNEEFQNYIQIRFASPMDFDGLKSRVQVSPAIEGETQTYFNEYDNSLYIHGLAPATGYVVRILPGMQDIYGNQIRDGYAYQFVNGDYRPYARLVLPWTPLVYRAQGEQDVYFEHLNVGYAEITVHEITANQFVDLQDGTLATAEFDPSTKPVRQWSSRSEARNQTGYDHFSLKTAAGSPLDPGFYFIGLRSGDLEYETNFYQGFVFIVATDNLTFKGTPTEGLAWVTDLESGRPRAGIPVSFFDEEFLPLGEVNTNKDGLAYLKNVDHPVYALAEGGKEFGFTDLNWGSGVSTGDFGIYENYYAGEKSLFGYLYTDRPVYRPNQEVYFKGILRQNDDLHYSLPEQKRAYVVVEQWGEKIYAEEVNVNAQGSFSGTVKLAENVSLGSYAISAYPSPAPDEAPFATVVFNVAEYRKPEFEVLLSPDKANALAGEAVKVNLDATYYSGGSLKEAEVNWFLESNPYYFYPSGDFNRYSFIDWDRDVYWSPGLTTGKDTFKEGKGVTDENGRLEIPLSLELGEQKISRQFTFSANVTDVAGNTVSGSTGFVLHQSEIYAGIRSESYVGTRGEPSRFDLVVLDWDSNPVPGQNVAVSFVERRWFSVQEKDRQGQLRWETSVREIPSGTQTAITGEDGTAQVSFTPSAGGVYKAVVTVRDSKGKSHQASTYLWVAGPQDVTWKQTNDRTFSLIADRDSYTPGDTAEILIAQPFEGEVYALVTYERGHIYKQEVVLLEGTSTIYKVPVTDELAPAAYVSVTVIRGAGDANYPAFKIGMTRINIDSQMKTVEVEVAPDKESAGPGEEVTYTIQTKDVNGEPVRADVSIAVVDKAVLALAPANSPPLLESFYPERGLSVMTALGLVSSADDFNEAYRKTIPDGSGSGGGGGGDLGVITVRENFKDTAFFRATVITDEKGQAEVTVKLPENLTTWHADVRAVTEDSRVGQTTHDLVSTKPLFVQLQTPRFFVAGDQAQIGAIIHNNTDAPREVNASLEALGLRIESEADQTVLVAGRQQAYVTWDVIVDDMASRVDLTASVTDGRFTDASKPPLGILPDQGIPVLTFAVQETVGTSGLLTSANSSTEAILLPTTIDFTDASLNIEVAPSLAASMGSGLSYLEDFEYLCMEQTVSRFLPNVISARAMELLDLESASRKDLDLQVNAALQRIYAKQLYDGGWNWWDGPESDAQTSAYVVYGLLEARESGYQISESVLANGIEYLKGNLPDLRRNDERWQFNRHAFMLYVLASAGELGGRQTNLIYEYRESLSLYGKAYLAQTLHLLDEEDPRIETLMSDLVSAAVLSASGAHWEEAARDYWNWNTDTRTTAIVLNAFVQIDPRGPVPANAVRWLMAHRESGHWFSTQETAWSLIALTNWMVESKELKADYKFAIGLNGDLLKEGRATRENLAETIELEVNLEDLLRDEVNKIVFTRGSGSGNLYYSAYMTATLPVEQVQALDQGVTLSREYFTLDDPKKPITEIARGELVKARLTIVLPAGVHYIVIDDPLPAGMEAVDSTLATDTLVPLAYTLQDYEERGWGWWYFDHVELHDERVTLSADYLPAGTYVYTYLARATTKGVFKVIPTTASEFYFPDVAGRGAGSIFTVE
jgi:uncharacterized protein YfaS (alpha-2-macroglobulin family)